MKKLLSFFVVLVLIIPMTIYGQTIYSVTVSKDTVNMNEKLEISVIWSSTNSNPVVTKVNYRDGKIDSVLTNPTPNTQYVSKFFHYYSVAGTFNILVNVGTTSTTKTVVVRGNPNQAPSAGNLLITGSLIVGKTLTGNYVYQDVDGDPEGVSMFKWYRNNVFIGTISQSYTLTTADLGAQIKFEVTPVAQTGVLIGSPVQSPTVGPIVNPNFPPVASNVAITVKTIVGETLTAKYDYSDVDGDIEGVSRYKWYRNNNPIVGATSIDYTLTVADVGSMIKFEVTPVAQTGIFVGYPVQSAFVGPIVNPNTAVVIEFVGYSAVINYPGVQQIDLRVKDDGNNVSIDLKIYSLPSNILVNHQIRNVNVTPNLSTHINLEPVSLPVGNYICHILASDSYLDTPTSFTFKVEAVTDVGDFDLPTEFNLSQNYPNPFNPTTNIKYSLPEPAQVNLIIYDMLGREVRALVNEYKNAGVHNVNFDGSNLTSGVYIYRIIAGKFVQTKKMTFTK